MNDESARQCRCHASVRAGFTLPEVLVVLVIAGILATIAAVSWRSFWNARLLTAAQDEVFQALRQAQMQARVTHSSWQASFQQADGVVKWTVHPIDRPTADANWHTLMTGVQLDPTQTTLLIQPNSIYSVEFDHRGYVLPPFGKLTLQIENGGNLRRCVVVSTLLGTMRRANQCH